MAGPLNRKFFFDSVRLNLFGGTLKQSQVDGLTALLDYWDNNHQNEDDRWLAYVLGTAYHEVDRKMQPIHEYGGTTYFMHSYDKSFNPSKANALGNTQVGDGATFHGRGFVQLTGRRNYTDWQGRLGKPLVSNPDLVVNDIDIATTIIFEGMIQGTFTGKRLAQYFDPNTDEWVLARRIVNGLDKANLIADYGKKFYGAISYTV
jgi:putative chitinase